MFWYRRKGFCLPRSLFSTYCHRSSPFAAKLFKVLCLFALTPTPQSCSNWFLSSFLPWKQLSLHWSSVWQIIEFFRYHPFWCLCTLWYCCLFLPWNILWPMDTTVFKFSFWSSLILLCQLVFCLAVLQRLVGSSSLFIWYSLLNLSQSVTLETISKCERPTLMWCLSCKSSHCLSLDGSRGLTWHVQY